MWTVIYKSGSEEPVGNGGESLYEILQIVKRLDNVDYIRYDSDSLTWTYRGVI